MRADKVVEIKIAIEGIEQAVKHIAYTEGKVDWEQRRYEIAKTVLPKMLDWLTSSGTISQDAIEDNRATRNAVFFADALIAELKKKGE